MGTRRSLPVIMPDVADQRWSCHSCGDCCRTLVGHLFDDERQRIEAQGWSGKLGVAATVRAGREWVLNKTAGGACVFLDEHNHCRIHAELGEEAKPLACRIFPFSVRPVSHGWQATLRYDCPSMVSSRGEPIRQQRDALTRIVAHLPHSPPSKGERALLQMAVEATVEEEQMILDRLRRWLRTADQPLSTRLIGPARLTTALREATLQNVRGARFAELVGLLIGSLPRECKDPPAPSTPRQRGMLRQLAFAHAEHVTLAELQGGFLRGWGKRLSQLRRAGRFRRGRGTVPDLHGFDGSAIFEQIDAVGPAREDRDAIESLMLRYLTARLEGRSVFGPGYYGWAMLDGLAALWMSVAVAGWLARLAAGQAQHERVTLDDVGVALRVVDRAATRLPALGSVSEKLRLRYLVREDGIARLLSDYALTENHA